MSKRSGFHIVLMTLVPCCMLTLAALARHNEPAEFDCTQADVAAENRVVIYLDEWLGAPADMVARYGKKVVVQAGGVVYTNQCPDASKLYIRRVAPEAVSAALAKLKELNLDVIEPRLFTTPSSGWTGIGFYDQDRGVWIRLKWDEMDYRYREPERTRIMEAWRQAVESIQALVEPIPPQEECVAADAEAAERLSKFFIECVARGGLKTK